VAQNQPNHHKPYRALSQKLSQKTRTSFALIGAGLVLTMVLVITQISSTNNALDFDGLDDHVVLTDLNPAGTSYTKEAWVYALSTGCNHIVSNQQGSLWLKNGYLRAGNDRNHYVVRDPRPFPVGSWIHVAVTYDAATTTMTLYRNGSAVKSNSSAPPNTGGPMAIGQHPWAGCHWHGQIDEVRIWDRALNQSEIQNQMHQELTLPANGLVAYFPFNDGLANGDNSSRTTTSDESNNQQDGILSGFALNGNSSNFVGSSSGVSSALPVEWLSFTTTEDNGIVSLQWSTATELNNTGFEVQRQAQDENLWLNLGFVESAEVGTQINQYQFQDLRPLQGENRYRLKQIDQNGAFSYSELRTVFVGTGKTKLQIFPNPAREELNVQLNYLDQSIETISLQVFDLQGRLVMNEIRRNGEELKLQLDFLQTGIYLLRAKVGPEIFQARFEKR
jgi:hypothetical protein